MTHSVTPFGHATTRRLRGSTRLLILACCALLAAGLVWGLGGAFASDPSPSPDEGPVTLRIGWTNDFDNLNPFIGAETSSYEIWLLNYDFLVGYDSEMGYDPGLATEWESSDDGKVWTFTLREGVSWQDGEPFTAADVKFTFDYIIDNEMEAFSAYTTNIDEVVVIDDYTVEMRCSEPKANLLRAWIPILPEHVWSSVKPGAARSSYRNAPPIVGTGPFQTVEAKKNDFVRMRANPGFWGQKPIIEEILFVTYQNPDTMTQDLLAGNLDAAIGLPAAQFDKVDAEPDMEGIAFNLLSWDYLNLNCYEGESTGHPALRDVAFRRALNHAIDKQRLCDVAWSGRADPGISFMTPDSWDDPDYHWNPGEEGLFPFDLELAGQLLDEAGYTDGDGDGVREGEDGKPIELRLWARTESPESQKQAGLLSGWFQDIGLKINYSVVDDGIYYDQVWNYDGDDTYLPDFDMYIWDWDGYADPGDTLACYTTGQIEWWNEPCWSNEEFDRTIEEQYAAMDSEQRKELVWRAQELAYSESPQIVLSYPDKLQAVNTAKWDGWTQMFGGEGAAFYTSYCRDSYLSLQPAGEAEEEGGSANTWIIVALAVAAAVVVVLMIVLRRGRHAAEEE